MTHQIADHDTALGDSPNLVLQSNDKFRKMFYCRNLLFLAWWFCMAVSIALHFVKWCLFVPGYLWPYHGMPSLALANFAVISGSIGVIRIWRERSAKWPWLVTILLVAVQVVFLTDFFRGPDVAIAHGTSVGPMGEAATISLPIDITPLWGAYAAWSAAVISLALSGCCLLACTWRNRTERR